MKFLVQHGPSVAFLIAVLVYFLACLSGKFVPTLWAYHRLSAQKKAAYSPRKLWVLQAVSGFLLLVIGVLGLLPGTLLTVAVRLALGVVLLLVWCLLNTRWALNTFCRK